MASDRDSRSCLKSRTWNSLIALISIKNCWRHHFPFWIPVGIRDGLPVDVPIGVGVVKNVTCLSGSLLPGSTFYHCSVWFRMIYMCNNFCNDRTPTPSSQPKGISLEDDASKLNDESMNIVDKAMDVNTRSNVVKKNATKTKEDAYDIEEKLRKLLRNSQGKMC